MQDFFRELPVLVPVIAAAITEMLKLIITYVKNGKIQYKDFFATGGIPSGHSAFVSALIISVLILEGYRSVEFAIASVFGFLVVFDAVKVRAEAGKHAAVLNKLMGENRLNERLGHNFFEVLTGIFLGSGLAFLMLTI